MLVEHIKRKLQVEDKEIKLRRLELKHELDLKRLENQHALDMAKLQLEYRPAENQSHRSLQAAEQEPGDTESADQRQLSECDDELDPVKAFAEEHIVSTTHDSDYVTQAMAYERYLTVTPEERNCETALGRNSFYSQLRNQFSQYFKAQHHVAGKRNLPRMCS